MAAPHVVDFISELEALAGAHDAVDRVPALLLRVLPNLGRVPGEQQSPHDHTHTHTRTHTHTQARTTRLCCSRCMARPRCSLTVCGGADAAVASFVDRNGAATLLTLCAANTERTNLLLASFAFLTQLMARGPRCLVVI